MKQPSWRGPSLLSSQNQSLRREIMLPAQRTNSFFVRPDAAGVEEAIGKFLDGLDGQEHSGFEELYKFLANTFSWLQSQGMRIYFRC